VVEEFDDIVKHYPEITGVHPACLAVPDIASDDLDALCKDVAENGLRHEIVLTKGGDIIDGRNRLRACHAAQVEPRFKRVATDPWHVAYSENIARRHLAVGQKAMFGAIWKQYEALEAKERKKRKPKSVPEKFPEQKADARDKAGERVGVSGKSVDKAEKIIEVAPDVASKVMSGEITLEAGFKEVKKRESASQSHPADKAVPVDNNQTTIVTASGVESRISLPKKVVFNKTTDAVDWARWTWNPVTGCDHGCKFCYAREIAYSQRMAPFYPNKFEPTYHQYRLEAPKNTPVPDTDDDRDGRVFVCSMADLFGKWVPDKWIRSVFDACGDSPQWEYLFLTKWPARYTKMPLIERAWYGASVIQQSDVKRVEAAMQQFAEHDVVRWISLEPMLQPIVFNDLSWCNLVVIGSQTSTNQPGGYVPEFAPRFDWVIDVVNQCRDAGVPYYLKANLGLERPGMELPKGIPS
jgi:protein gp37